MGKSKKRRSKANPNPRKCRHCKSSSSETFRYMSKQYIYDVDRAREITSDGRKPVEVDPESVRYSVDNCRIHDDHVPHVNTTYPGIIAHLQYVTAAGERVKAHLLIDGNHRAARCLQLGIPYMAYVLTEAETKAVLIRSQCDFEVSEDAALACVSSTG